MRRSTPPTSIGCARRIVHRGPDDEGIYARGPVGLGMRRLSIIDLSGGHQPIHNEDQSIWLVYNGEIYNFPELRLVWWNAVTSSIRIPTQK